MIIQILPVALQVITCILVEVRDLEEYFKYDAAQEHYDQGPSELRPTLSLGLHKPDNGKYRREMQQVREVAEIPAKEADLDRIKY